MTTNHQTIPALKPKQIARFWRHVEKGGRHECWPWTGFRLPDGYGRVGFYGVKYLAHRVAYRMRFGDFDPRLVVCHACDNPVCCNPDHLVLGTYWTNVADCKAKGRLATGTRNGRHTHPEATARGEWNGAVKLTSAEVRQIRDLRGVKIGVQFLADAYGVTTGQISRVARGKAWRFLEVAL